MVDERQAEGRKSALAAPAGNRSRASALAGAAQPSCIRLEVPATASVGPYVIDFACLDARLLIEIDGYWHALKKSSDAARDRYLKAQEFDVVRFDIENEFADVDSLVQMIAHEAKIRIER